MLAPTSSGCLPPYCEGAHIVLGVCVGWICASVDRVALPVGAPFPFMVDEVSVCIYDMSVCGVGWRHAGINCPLEEVWGQGSAEWSV